MAGVLESRPELAIIRSLHFGTLEMESSHRAAFTRMALGVLQMIGAFASASLLLHSGGSALSFALVVITLSSRYNKHGPLWLDIGEEKVSAVPAV